MLVAPSGRRQRTPGEWSHFFTAAEQAIDDRVKYRRIDVENQIAFQRIGLEQAGFCCVVQHEIDAMCCETLIANRPNFFRHAALIQGDIYKTPTSMLLEEAGLRVGEVALTLSRTLYLSGFGLATCCHEVPS